MKIIISTLFLVAVSSTLIGQPSKDLVSLRLGYSSTNIIFKEAVEPSVAIFGKLFNTGKSYCGSGPEIGFSKDINRNLSADVAFSIFSGADTRKKVNYVENYYTLKGYRIPVTANYLFGEGIKRFQVNLGAGFQYLVAHLQQYETTTGNIGPVTDQKSDITISELQILLRPGVQFRVIPNLFVLFIVDAAVSTTGRYSDHPCLSLKYHLKKSVKKS